MSLDRLGPKWGHRSQGIVFNAVDQICSVRFPSVERTGRDWQGQQKCWSPSLAFKHTRSTISSTWAKRLLVQASCCTCKTLSVIVLPSALFLRFASALPSQFATMLCFAVENRMPRSLWSICSNRVCQIVWKLPQSLFADLLNMDRKLDPKWIAKKIKLGGQQEKRIALLSQQLQYQRTLEPYLLQ